MSDEKKTPAQAFYGAVAELRKTSGEARMTMHSHVAATRPIDAWAAMGEAYPTAGPSANTQAVAAVPASTQTIVTVPVADTKKSLASGDSVRTVATAKAQAPGMSAPAYQVDDTLAKGNWAQTSSSTQMEDILKSIQSRPTNMTSVRDPFSDDFYTSETKTLQDKDSEGSTH